MARWQRSKYNVVGADTVLYVIVLCGGSGVWMHSGKLAAQSGVCRRIILGAQHPAALRNGSRINLGQPWRHNLTRVAISSMVFISGMFKSLRFNIDHDHKRLSGPFSGNRENGVHEAVYLSTIYISSLSGARSADSANEGGKGVV